VLALARHLFSQDRGYCARDDARQIGPKRHKIVAKYRDFLAQLADFVSQLAQFGAHIEQQGFVLAQLRQGLAPRREAQQAPLFIRPC
jgi:cytochrome c551/c552